MDAPEQPRVVPGTRSPGRLSLRIALVQLGLLGAALTAVEIALFVHDGTGPVALLVAYASTGLLYLAAGIVAWSRRPSGRIGALLCLCGFGLLASAIGNVAVPALAVVGVVLAELPIGVMLHLLLAFPSGRLRDRASRVLTVGGYVVTVGLEVPLYLFGGVAEWPAELVVADRPDLADLSGTVQTAAGFVVIVAAAWALVRRLRAADRAQRRVLAAVSGYGIFTILFLTLSAIVARAAGIAPLTLFALQLIVIVGLPFAFLAGILRGGFARTANVEELGVWLGSSEGARPALREALSATLGDPSLTLLYWLSDGQRYVDADGHAAPLPSPGSPRSQVPVEVAGAPVGAIVYDGVLIGEPELVRAAGRVVALAVERERLTAELLASRTAVRESRARIVESGDRERRRVARDLHDGLQAQLVVLALRAGQLAVRSGAAAPFAAEADQVRADAEAAIVQLRGLVHGILPALLVQRGLYAATAELVDRLPIPGRLDRPEHDAALPAAVETAGYFTIAEALANAVKHSAARQLQVRLATVDRNLEIEVCDDGVGGARLDPGGGLSGIADRVEALGGHLTVVSPRGGGTSLVAELPCGS